MIVRKEIHLTPEVIALMQKLAKKTGRSLKAQLEFIINEVASEVAQEDKPLSEQKIEWLRGIISGDTPF